MTNSQKAVARVLRQFPKGLTDQALVPVVQHVANEHLSSSGIRTRRRELADMAYVVPVGEVKMPSGRAAAVWAINPETRRDLTQELRRG